MSDKAPLQTLNFFVSGESFRVRTDLPEAKLAEIAAYVESIFTQHLPNGSQGDNRKKLVLATMEIAGELLDAKEKIAELEGQRDKVNSKTQELVQSLDDLEK